MSRNLFRNFEKDQKNCVSQEKASQSLGQNKHCNISKKEDVKKQINFSFEDDDKENIKAENQSELFNKICNFETPFTDNPFKRLSENDLSKLPFTVLGSSETKVGSEAKQKSNDYHNILKAYKNSAKFSSAHKKPLVK